MPSGALLALLSLSELHDPHGSGSRLRARCPVHGSNRQRSLSIDRATGWGFCHACHCRVLVLELNQPMTGEALQRLELPAPSPASLPAAEHLAQTFSPVLANPPPGEATARSSLPPPPASPSSQHPGRRAQPWQQEERAALYEREALMQQALATLAWPDCWQAQAYLHERHIELELALAQGVGYLSEGLLAQAGASRSLLWRWGNRLIFPLYAQAGRGYIGRTLWRWQLGMAEEVHKALLDEQAAAPLRWLKTQPAGHASVPPVQLASCLVLVEGAFDRLALLSGGFAPEEVVALVGTQAQASWFPEQVKALLLALDADASGLAACSRLAARLSAAHLLVETCPPPADGRGKDWSERWRRWGAEGLAELYEAYVRLGGRI